MAFDSIDRDSASQAAVFGDIAQVAEQERRRLFGPAPESQEIAALREQASQVARKVIAEALAQAQALREEARQEGYRAGFTQGYQEGLATGQAEMQRERLEYRADIEGLVERIETERQRIWREAEPQIVAFVLEVAGRVVKDEALVNREVVMSVVRNALRRVIETDHVRIRVNAQDLEGVRASREELMAMLDGMRHIEIVEDRRVGPGGCVLETDAGTIDARLETQLAEIETSLLHLAEEAA